MVAVSVILPRPAPSRRGRIIKNPEPLTGKIKGKNMAEQPKDTPTAEEIKQEEAEEEELTTATEESLIKEKIIDDLGLDEEADFEIINKLVKEKVEDRKRFGKVVGQKRKWREQALKKPEVETKKEQPSQEEKIGKDEVEKLLLERDFKNELKSLDISDELKKQVESYAKANNCSPKEAFKSEFISFLKEKEDKKRQEEEAAIGGTRRTRPGKGGELTPETFKADDYDLTTEEGRKQMQEDMAKAFGKK